eukprot:TRINITY_DN6347_c2_g1_i1.p2 TRINITY_DN6347_c2_g1~~TRINITY_DN6347_c2_g1_i1.p2  ORF type:complete len:316 (+),score=40.67 TRINITY_DN6347_c2_g1_i1:186-1133(+)
MQQSEFVGMDGGVVVQPIVKKIVQPIIIGKRIDFNNTPLPPTEVLELRELFRQKVLPPSTFQKKMIKFSDKESILRLQQLTNKILESTPEMSSYKMWLQDSEGQNYQAGFRLEKNASKTLDSYVLYCSELFGSMYWLQPEDSLFLYFTDDPRVIRFEVKQSDKPRIVGAKVKRSEIMEEIGLEELGVDLSQFNYNYVVKSASETPAEAKSEADNSSVSPQINEWVYMLGMMACISSGLKRRKLGSGESSAVQYNESPIQQRGKRLNVTSEHVKMMKSVVNRTNEALASTRKAMVSSGAALQRSNVLLQELFKNAG